MSDPLAQALEQACHRFAAQPGQISILIESNARPVRVAINETTSLAAASVIKPAIACAAAADRAIDLSQSVDVREMDQTQYCSIMAAFEPMDTLTLRELIGMMLIVSDNPATTAVLDHVGFERVNAWLSANGLRQTSLKIGFEDRALGSPLRANRTTAEDCLTLLKLINREPDYAFIKTLLENNLRNERIPKRLPDDVVVAHKTGTLNGLVHDIALIESPQTSYYFILLADDLPDTPQFAFDLAVFSEQVYGLMSG